ncbi:MAG: DUF2062 domain-containing protein [Bdellovibrionales bacterium]|nr:DUF2062 domain-containing protein [Bdellovibrionales bacterium]
MANQERAGSSLISSYFARIIRPVLDQLKGGADPERLSLAATLGALIGIIPILGISTGIAVVVGAALRLNHVVLQAVNYLVYPLQLMLFPVFLKLGGVIFGGDSMEFDLTLLRQELSDSLPAFLSKYGMIGAKAVGVWAVLSIMIGIPLRLILNSLFRKIHSTWNRPS